jgi:4-hydroxyacetophenone monooxygenase
MGDAMPDFSTDLAGADDDTIRAAVAQAELPALLPALAAASGDHELIPSHLRPSATGLMDPTGGLSPEQQAEARELAVGALVALRDGPGPVDVTELDVDTLRTLLEFASGGAPVDDYLELLREELNLGDDLRTPDWQLDELAPDRTFRVVVIGAGMSGLVAAYRLRQAGIDVVVVDKNADVGGTWFENRYPGCRVDVSNLFYSYSFAQRDDWPEHYSSQRVLLDYFRHVADTTGVRSVVRFDTEVTEVTYDDERAVWTVRVDGPDGDDTIEAEAVVSAVGQLNRPRMPDIAGIDRFAGPSFHSARWDHDVDLAGKRVAVVGTGASAAQFITAIASTTAELTIFQRTPAWFIPAPQYTDAISPEVRWLRRNVPGYANWNRFWVFWRNVEGMMPAARVDPDWTGDERTVSETNELMRTLLTGYLTSQFDDRPDLLDQVVPDYPPFAKRFILDNGAWASTLKSEHVHLVTDRIAEITEAGVRTADGTVHEADVIIYGTGFAASDFLTPMKVVGRGGVDLHERWAGDARAYLGITLPDFPNFFMLYGPNTNIVANGSIIYFSECEVHYILGCIHEMLVRGLRAIEPTVEAHDAYNAEIDEQNLRMAWGVSSVSSWYKNATGRTAQNWPFSLLDFWQRTRRPDLEHYEVR